MALQKQLRTILLAAAVGGAGAAAWEHYHGEAKQAANSATVAAGAVPEVQDCFPVDATTSDGFAATSSVCFQMEKGLSPAQEQLEMRVLSRAAQGAFAAAVGPRMLKDMADGLPGALSEIQQKGLPADTDFTFTIKPLGLANEVMTGVSRQVKTILAGEGLESLPSGFKGDMSIVKIVANAEQLRRLPSAPGITL
jgi:hypothetical protein